MNENIILKRVKRSKIVIFGISFALSFIFLLIVSLFAFTGFLNEQHVVYLLVLIPSLIFIISYIGQLFIPEIISPEGVFHFPRRILWSEIKSINYVVEDKLLHEFKDELNNDSVKDGGYTAQMRAGRSGARALALLYAEESPSGRLVNLNYVIFSQVNGYHFLVRLAPYKLTPKEFIEACHYFSLKISVGEKILPSLDNRKQSILYLTMLFGSIIVGTFVVILNPKFILHVGSLVSIVSAIFIVNIVYMNSAGVRRLLKTLNL